MEKLIRALLVGVIAALASAVGFGWNAYSRINNMGREIKSEIKSEMTGIRNRDMHYIDQRFNTIEVLMVGKVVSPPRDESKDSEE